MCADRHHQLLCRNLQGGEFLPLISLDFVLRTPSKLMDLCQPAIPLRMLKVASLCNRAAKVLSGVAQKVEDGIISSLFTTPRTLTQPSTYLKTQHICHRSSDDPCCHATKGMGWVVLL
jgi:hypothetical protein